MSAHKRNRIQQRIRRLVEKAAETGEMSREDLSLYLKLRRIYLGINPWEGKCNE